MDTVVNKRLAAVEKRLAEISERLDKPKSWRNAVGALSDTKLSREADAMGRLIRRKQTKP